MQCIKFTLYFRVIKEDMPIFRDDELQGEFKLQKDELPRINDVLKYVLSRNRDRSVRIRELSNEVVKLWEKADCCPHSILRVTQLFGDVYDKYIKYLKKSRNTNHRKRVATSPPPEPSRRSSRTSKAVPITPVVSAVSIPISPSVPSSSKSTQSKPDNHFIVRQQWDAEFGNNLFDVLNKNRITDVLKNGGAFDSQFYLDQSGPRTLIMQIRKVTKEFRQLEVNRLAKGKGKVNTTTKVRAMKAQRIGKGDRATWAEVVLHMLRRLTVASENDITVIWESIRIMLSDLCKVNKNLAAEVSKLIGSSWIPGQLFFVLHYVLAIPESIKAVFTMYQGQIGREKLFPETTGFEMNINDKTVVIQILDVWMRLTSIRWHGRMWNRYNNFTTFAEKRGIRNVGHMIHANRFGEFEERCAGGVYLAETWMLWLQSFTDVRNTLSCYLRTVNSLMEICIFQWATAALVGLHVTVPFMAMLLDYKATQRELLNILPKLYSDLLNYNISFIKFDGPAIKSLEPFWQDPFKKNSSPFGVDVLEALQRYTDTCDKETMDKSLKDITKHMAATLKRQRGDAYGFGDNPNSDDYVTKDTSTDMLDDPDATHAKPVENYFGNLDRYIAKTGPQGFDKVTDDLVLKYGKDLITDCQYEWRSRESKQSVQQLKELQNWFDEKQQML